MARISDPETEDSHPQASSSKVKIVDGALCPQWDARERGLVFDSL